MDGNGRWANAQGKVRVKGHKKGMDVARETVENCARAGVKVLTLFAFSSENWKRPEDEVSYLMGLFIEGLSREAKSLLKNNIKIQVIGERSQLSKKLQKAIHKAEQLTQGCDQMVLNIATNYGGRWDIVNATKNIAKQVLEGTLSLDDIDEQGFSDNTCLSDLADPDLFIRTGGEHRISNFLIWQLAYSELYFTDLLWPDFNKDALEDAFFAYSSRQRRFGQTGEQVISRVTSQKMPQNISHVKTKGED
ncbi:MAG: di-trans,poly-cis-decaprenylcistransferase [Gammaproteobacteria bacterium]|nr:MAG: di-trans,poly-cis-decaprenylcistransferase [Gammaproteobacteria bacterium]